MVSSDQHLKRGMAEHLRDPAWVFPARQGMRCEGMPGVVEIARLELGLLERGIPDAATQVVIIDMVAARVREDELATRC